MKEKEQQAKINKAADETNEGDGDTSKPKRDSKRASQDCSLWKEVRSGAKRSSQRSSMGSNAGTGPAPIDTPVYYATEAPAAAKSDVDGGDKKVKAAKKKVTSS